VNGVDLMPVFRVEKTRNYTVMSNFHLKDKNLSLKSKGLLSLILSLPDEWNYTTRGLAAVSKEGVDSIGAALKELEAEKYLARNRLRDERGRITDTEYIVYEFPQKKPHTSLPDMASPHTENPYTDKPYTENPAQLNINKDLKATDELNKKQKHPRVPDDSPMHGQLSLEDAEYSQQAECLTVKTARGAGKPVNHTITLVEQQFESFWRLYPRKAGRKTAKKAWNKLKPDEVLFSTIISALNNAVQYWNFQGVSLKHIPHPSTWLNEERWEDEFSSEQFSSCKGLTLTVKSGGEQIVTIGTNYTIGGENDPYRELMPN
jgi:hypothetical protein